MCNVIVIMRIRCEINILRLISAVVIKKLFEFFRSLFQFIIILVLFFNYSDIHVKRASQIRPIIAL